LAKDFEKDDSIAKVVEEIGTGQACFTQNNINDLVDAMMKGGYTAAEAKAAQFMGTDGYTDLLRVLEIMQKHKLSPEAAAEVLKNLFQIKAGHW
jgi:polyhydroxyalkanoate synthesis regulator phasin